MSEPNLNNSSNTDWAKVDALSDSAIDTSETPPLGNAFFAKANLRIPRNSVQVTIQVDSDVLTWFRQLGPDWEQRASAALRIYAEAHQAAVPAT
jgi:uncharacterized protein (DUF4415 family)